MHCETDRNPLSVRQLEYPEQISNVDDYAPSERGTQAYHLRPGVFAPSGDIGKDSRPRVKSPANSEIWLENGNLSRMGQCARLKP
jgi:hypothetical protein